MAENDVQLDLKKRARRRLVGAIALALVAAIVLPMVMDSEPAPGSQELSIRIPSQEGGNYASRLIAGAAPPPASPVLPAQSVPAAKPAELAPAVAQSTVVPPPVPEMPAQSAPKPAAKPPVEAQRARDILEGRSDSSAAVRSAEAKPAEPKPAESKPAATGRFFVQLGVYREEANAREVATRASSSGVKASLEKQADRTRVRAGPYADRASADKVVEKLKKAGLNGIVTSK
ncbi:SPOR domain-containing protein [Uliginosibacterium aquaticum]|uniref:SPOR domain-containing protein n=1 Tax=Uliginosibacterium aquaticum TaxID=2731212 RepID=A0ABX2IER0_9RHOO|nr:SPOR domain-containing protein [Uliginosibacterium aquaticum]NSL55139.1 SPOR domain-containing protein [Uliginosibacterium aquaticum]